jgi:hypothetical protein
MRDFLVLNPRVLRAELQGGRATGGAFYGLLPSVFSPVFILARGVVHHFNVGQSG